MLQAPRMYSTKALPHEGPWQSAQGPAYLFCLTVMPFCFRAFSLAICRS